MSTPEKKMPKETLSTNVYIPPKILAMGDVQRKVPVVVCQRPLTIVCTDNPTEEHIAEIKQRMKNVMNIQT